MSDRYLIPVAADGSMVKKRLGHDWLCPFCRAQKTSYGADTGWIETPLIAAGPQWICAGCAIDLYITCLSSDFASHPYYTTVCDAANVVGRSPQDFRKICLLHQKEIAERRSHGPLSHEYVEIHDRIVAMLQESEA